MSSPPPRIGPRRSPGIRRPVPRNRKPLKKRPVPISDETPVSPPPFKRQVACCWLQTKPVVASSSNKRSLLDKPWLLPPTSGSPFYDKFYYRGRSSPASLSSSKNSSCATDEAVIVEDYDPEVQALTQQCWPGATSKTMAPSVTPSPVPPMVVRSPVPVRREPRPSGNTQVDEWRPVWTHPLESLGSVASAFCPGK